MSEIIKGEPMLNKDHFPEATWPIINVIERIRGQGGEEYEGSTELARRNPVKPDTAPLLTAYAALRKPKHVFEMGTAYGFSALHIGLGSAESFLDTVEFDESTATEAQENLNEAGLLSKVFPGTVQQRIGAGITSVDFVFIDHDKKSYLPDFQALEPYLTKGALVLADNVNDRRAETTDFVEYMQKYGAIILPTQAGLLVAEV